MASSLAVSPPFLGGLGLFAIGLLIGGLAPMQVLVLARFIQGLGAGAIPPVAYVAIARSMPEELRPRMFAWLSTAWALPGVMGPAIAGIVGDTIGWRAVFLGLLPLVVVAVTTTPALRAVAPPPEAVDAEARRPPRSAGVCRWRCSSPRAPRCSRRRSRPANRSRLSALPCRAWRSACSRCAG